MDKISFLTGCHYFVSILVFFLASFSQSQAGFLSLNESAEIVPQGKYTIGFEPQLRISDGSGANVSVFTDAGLTDEWSTRIKLGGGYDDFYGSFGLKWVPIPDFENQPAIGLKADSSLGRNDGESIWTFRVAPLISKGFDLDEGKIIPYAALPLGLLASKGSSKSISHFVLGSELLLMKLPDSKLSAEVGFNLSNTFSYVSGSWTWTFSM